MAVQRDDRIEIPAEGWGKPITIIWTETFSKQQGEYYKVPFTNNNEDREQGMPLFIQKDQADKFKSRAENGRILLTVGDAVSNGQNSEGQNRWLVYHDKSRDIFQHRFVQHVFQAWLEAAEKFKPFGRFGNQDPPSSPLKARWSGILAGWLEID
ncbi:unnamed protein product [Zymoseptoria tritici ST99CH_3D7]|uniref:Uncharacterized protein n=3 Tax=Zymoseptoria tritici TaxID=1047171 RepID=F9X4Q8_ZYMTI|nr:uncharacterized protein MYCGRDRAFT_91202 [Zymoseptoria tritici IPO323]EGP90161.1 hypothetical protein MYCGRDRAFT_91202 [Zymoseptoria tritici IPO323]SMQ48179.1 unnamed protein product [Zymoseptoria tritici ST99CH_3D7]SMR46723.1 unnamed protein product [Zymoseptoria tritici ST99CH_1E4]